MRSRSNTGQATALVLLAVAFIVALAGALIVDTAHVQTVQKELQRATDAAALAGAIDLYRAPKDVERHARRTAAENRADGKPVSDDSPNTDVTVTVTAPGPNEPGRVEVTAQMTAFHSLMRMLGRSFDSVSARSVAGASGPLHTNPENETFPLAVSIDAVPRRDKNGQADMPLNEANIGDTVRFYIGSQQVKNAAWTSFTEPSTNAKYIQEAVDQSLGLQAPTPGLIPPVAVGDSIGLNNGILGQKDLAKSPRCEALLGLDYIILPVIQGDPAMSQSRPVIGFISVKVTEILVDKDHVVESLVCTLLQTVTTGSGGPLPPTDDELDDAAMKRLAVQSAHLIE